MDLLEMLPPELLDLITRQLDGTDIIRLWISASKRTKKILGEGGGVTCFNLLLSEPRLCRWPTKIINQFPKLKQLHFITSEPYHYIEIIDFHISKIPRGLECLQLGFANALDLITQLDHLVNTAPHGGSHIWFPELKHLYLKGATNLDGSFAMCLVSESKHILPKLEILSIPEVKVHDKDLWPNMSLPLTMPTGSQYTRNITHLKANIQIGLINLKWLPRSLTFLSGLTLFHSTTQADILYSLGDPGTILMPEHTDDQTEAQVAALFSHLYNRWFQENNPVKAALLMEKIVQRTSFPPNLTYLDCYAKNYGSAIYASLPNSLKTLHFTHLREFDTHPRILRIKPLPPTLTELKLCSTPILNASIVPITEEDISSLPDTLTSLDLGKGASISPAMLSRLPPSLTSIIAQIPLKLNSSIDLTNLQNLKIMDFLNVSIDCDLAFRQLPQTLTSLTLGFPSKRGPIGPFTSKSTPLPSSLTQLKVNAMIDTVFMKSLPPTLLHLECSVPRWNAEVINSLPRSLRSLKSQSLSKILPNEEPVEWPPYLETLCMPWARVDEAYLSRLPPTLTHLRISYIGSSSVFEMLPRGLKVMELGHELCSLLTQDALKLPPRLARADFNFLKMDLKGIDLLPKYIKYLGKRDCFGSPYDKWIKQEKKGC